MKKTSPFEGKRLALFDLDGTIRDVRPSGIEAMISYAADAGLRIGRKQRLQIIRWTHKYWASDSLVKDDMARLESEVFWLHYLMQQLIAIGVKEKLRQDAADYIMGRFRDDFAPEPYLVEGTKELMWGLRSAGIVVGLVSNRDMPLTGLAIELGVIDHFNFTLAAGQVNSWKPDAVIFEHALSMGGDFKPAEAVYIGDNYFADVVGAQNVGMNAVLIDGERVFPEAEKECMIIAQLSDLKEFVPA